jgi:asparagine synthase (glutamine-hydrolysing)
MCGIAGAISSHVDAAVGSFALSATRALAHRGPDGDGFLRVCADRTDLCTADRAGAPAIAVLGHRRLSIIDLAGGAQPMSDGSDTVWITFNGEIYNHLELRQQLIGRGHQFSTHCDTEVIVHGWKEWGAGVFERLNGIFAVALLDTRTREVVLARDPMGVKPLYVGVRGAMTWWSSELNAAQTAGATNEISRDALKLFLLFRFVPSPFSIFDGSWKVPPGHYCRIRSATAGQQPEFTRYLSRVRSAASPRSREQWRDAMVGELEASVKRQLMSDVPVASLLSGGVDSTLITQLMSEHLPYAPETFGIGFASDGADSEARAAEIAAAELHVPHTSITAGDDDYIASWPAAVRQVGEPVANSGGLLVRWLCDRVGERHKVVLSGQGADEPLGGYPRHLTERFFRIARTAPRAATSISGLLFGGERSDRLERVLAAPDRLDRYATILGVLRMETIDALVLGASAPARELARGVLSRWVPDEEPQDPLNEVLIVDSRMSLADDLLLIGDHHSMAASVELRVPFLDLAFVELVERMPSRFKVSLLGERKWLYREAAARRLPRTAAQRLCGIRARVGKKRGFTTPLTAWFASQAGPLRRMENWLPAVERIGAIRMDALRGIVNDDSNRDASRQRALFYALAMWAKQ